MTRTKKDILDDIATAKLMAEHNRELASNYGTIADGHDAYSAKLQSELAALEPKEWPQDGEKVFTPWSRSWIAFSVTNESHQALLAQGLFYSTFEQAAEAGERMAAVVRVNKKIAEFNGDWKPDWLDADQEKYTLWFDFLTGTVAADVFTTTLNGFTFTALKSNPAHTPAFLASIEQDVRIVAGVK